jgi:hypothetical protein
MASMRGFVRVFVLLAAVLAVPATAFAESPRIDDLRAAHGAASLPRTVAAGDVTVTPAEGVASITQVVVLHVANGPAVQVAFPPRFSESAANGRPFMRGRPSTAIVDAGADLRLDVSGLPAGTYTLPLRRGARRIGTATFRLYTPEREGDADGRSEGPFGPVERVPLNTSFDSAEESEPFVAVDPADANRIVTAANVVTASGVGGVNVTVNGGLSQTDWTHLTFKTKFALGAGAPVKGIPGGDPILAADDAGNLWAGGLSRCDPSAPTSRSHIFVNRISFVGTIPTFQANNAALPNLHSGISCPSNPDAEVLQDKPQMTIDNWPASPTHGRLYVTWDDPDPSGGVNVVMSYCDTSVSLSTCDSGSGWSTPVVVSDHAGGSYISSDPAVGPDGTLYVAWWDYSATNAIAIDSCKAAVALAPCTGFGTDRIVASLSSHLGRIVPFACPTLAQPGGRAAPVPSLALDKNGRIYAAWGDLGTTGTTRCGFEDDGSMTLPDAKQDAFNAYVASADNYDRLTANPTSASASGTRGTNVFGDPGDHWFPWVAVDRDTGAAAVALYSTRLQPSRQTANYWVRPISPDATNATTRVRYGEASQVSAAPSDYSDQACGLFGNDYGDYAGLAASSSVVFPVWDLRPRGGEGEVYIGPFGPHPTTFEAPQDNPPLPTSASEYLPQCSPPPPPPPPPTTTTTTTTPPPPPPPPVDRTAPRLKVTLSTRVDRKRRYTVKLAAAGEPAKGSAVLRLTSKGKRKLASGLIATSGKRSVKLVLRLKRKDFHLLRRKHKLRVRLTVSLSDVAGNRARASKTFTLRLRRR